MKAIKTLVLTAILAIPLSLQAASVWKVTNGKNTVYFGGTVHILNADNLPLPAEYDKAYAASDKVVFETDIVGAQSAEFQQKLMSKMILSDGSTLKTRLNEKTYAALVKYLDSKGMPIENFLLLRPSITALTITVLEYQANGFNQEGVDQIYATKASEDVKPIEWFESIDEQIGFMINLGGDDENAMINYTLKEIETLPTMMDDMLLSWKNGDLDRLNETVIKEMASSSPIIYDDLIVKRNNNWMPKVLEMLNDEPTEFVLVGSAHLAGKDSIFAKLEAQGFKIEKLK
jgi:uncharacterized protein YbaP (TraB family)